MTDPKRWQQEGAPADYARLFRAVRSEQPSPASLQRALVSAGAVGATSLVAHAAASAVLGAAGSVTGATAKGGLVSIAAKLVAASLVSAAAVGTTVMIVEHHREVVARSAAIASSSHTRPIAAPVQSVPVASMSMVPSAPATVPSVPTALVSNSVMARFPQAAPIEKHVAQHDSTAWAKKPTRSSVPASPSAADDSRTLFEEMGLIDAARANLRSGNPAEALRTARDYNRRYAAGRFAPEALFLSMQASRQLGQWQVATDAARAIIVRFPNGPHVGRARELLQSQGVSDIP